MDTDLLKSVLPVIGGALALLGGVFTFVSGRLRDAPDEVSKLRVMTRTWANVAVVFWLVGISLVAFANRPLFGIPFFAATLAIQTKQFLSGPKLVFRDAIALFVFNCVLAAFTILFAIFVYFFDLMLASQNQQLEVLRNIIDSLHQTADSLKR